ncbi:MAG: hypothetical protein JXR15_13235 [Shimia sp.]|uniref:hypothetical protein n=1 Tax=Shimia sp. TaxID=1954381 RepID=UPI003B8DBC4F
MDGMTGTAEGTFVAAIISQAYSDMLGPNDDHAYTATTFLTAPNGRHARWRGELFGLLGLDGDIAARRIVEGLEGLEGLEGNADLHPFTLETSDQHTAQVELARKRWLYLKHPHALPASSV